jgi:hypothetical protein
MQLLEAARIRAYLEEVADELGSEGPDHEIVIVGGSLLAWHGIRSATFDVDTISRMSQELIAAVATVANRHGLAPSWLNDSAAPFAPWAFLVDRCEVLIDVPRLRVLGAAWDDVLIMKIHAARVRSQDRDDLVAMWPLAGLSPSEALDRYQQGYPHAPEDEFLLGWIEAIADESTWVGPLDG